MALDDAQLSALKVEITTDPDALGLSFGDPVGTAVILNEASASYPITVDGRPASEITEVLDYTEVEALTTEKRETLLVLLSVDFVPLTTKVKNAFASIFAAGPTRTALQALQTRDGSKVEALFGAGVVATHTDVSNSETAA